MIVINARFLTQPITGVQRFAVEISKVLKRKIPEKVHFVTHPGVIHQDLFKELDAEVLGFNKSHIWEQIDLYIYLVKNNKPLLLSFGYTGPLFYRNQIVSIHDMAFKYYRETFSKSFSTLYNFLVPKIAKKCFHVITVSESAKKELISELNIPSKKITVVYNGLSDVFTKKSPPFFDRDRYILTVSSHHPRKNYKRLIKAFSLLDDKSIKLFVIGNEIGHFSQSLEARDFDFGNRVKFLRNVSDEQLSAYYENAELFVFPSLYEGFGIPFIEAMSKNIRCVVSDIPVFKEIAGESVIFVDPTKVESILKGIEAGLFLEKKKIDNRIRERFSWETSANRVIELIK